MQQKIQPFTFNRPHIGHHIPFLGISSCHGNGTCVPPQSSSIFTIPDLTTQICSDARVTYKKEFTHIPTDTEYIRTVWHSAYGTFLGTICQTFPLCINNTSKFNCWITVTEFKEQEINTAYVFTHPTSNSENSECTLKLTFIYIYISIFIPCMPMSITQCPDQFLGDIFIVHSVANITI